MSDVQSLIARLNEGWREINASPCRIKPGSAIGGQTGEASLRGTVQDISMWHAEALPEAADAIAAQAAEIERLTRELADGSFYKESDIDALQARAEAAEAEAEKLRAALAFLRPSQWEEGDISGITFDSRWLAEHIDAALGRKG